MVDGGVGVLQMEYERLFRKLSEEGLFSEARKRPIPTMPRCIGIVTSPTGAAVRDMINVTGRRWPMAKILIYPSLVQGAEAPASLCAALGYLNAARACDVIIIGRGGGSIEDLWAFNGEALARRIYDATTPIISAVGHETDFTICDFVADMRAPTPSAAAEIAVPDRRELVQRLDSFDERLSLALLRKISSSRERMQRINDRMLGFSPTNLIKSKREKLLILGDKATYLVNNRLEKSRDALLNTVGKADALNPLSILLRGYSVAEKDGKIIKSKDELSLGDKISVRLSDGYVSAEITNKEI
jgi:exodeoxyribonuclease VII large subunit